ncbi:phage tail tape measure protein [Chromobacterium violaceum]|uniref:phage tail tape measure protein n=1 Tax=Chromobacterium violaceum TaxID=536 RepID=UPI0019523D18|nr:phage tail tape measure protein [Chromobacterium violaceum]QRO34124.1 phage tail tape measure protein [Chromobacterium violaceum]QRQ16073.1 phage tail tape measure protein [Chromobacterium violaceum]
MDLIQFGIVLKAFDQMSGVFGSAASKSMGALGRLDQKVSAVSDRLDRMGTKALGDGAILAGLIQKPVVAFAEAEDAATGLKVAMMGAGGELDARFGKINKLATDLGDKLPGTTADFQNMMTALVKQGISYDAILGGVGKSAAYLGVMMKKPPEQAAEFVAKLQDATGTAEKDMMSLMDTIQRATYLGVNDSNMLQFYTKMTPAMDTMKRKGAEAAKEMAPFAVMFDQAGMQGEAAGNALRKVVQLGMDLKKVNKVNAGLAKLGIKLDFSDGKGEFAGMGNMMLQLDKLKKLSTADQLKALKEIFGDDAETLQVLSILINKGVDGYNETVDKMAKQADLQRRVNEQLGTLKNLWDAASGTFTNALSAFGEQMSPEVKALTQWLGNASEGLSDLIKQHPKLSRFIGLGVGGFAALLLVGGGLAMTLGSVGRLAEYALGPLGKLGRLFKRGKGGVGGGAGAAAEALGVQRVWVTNWPAGMGGGGMDLGDVGGGKGGKPSSGPAGKPKGRLARLGGAIKSGASSLVGGGKLAAIGKLGGAALAVGTAGYMAYDTYKTAKTGEQKGAGYGGALGSLGGGLAGAKVGALVGTMVLPGIGTVVGGLLGGALGALAGEKLGSLAGGGLGQLADRKPEPGRLDVTKMYGPPGTGLPAAAAPVLGKTAPVPAPVPVPLNPIAASRDNALAGAAQPAAPQLTLNYNPALTIQGDPIPGTDAKFKALLSTHRDELLRMINQALENKARAAYG